MNEEFIENNALAWFKETGWEVFHGKDLLPEGTNPQRNELSAVVLEPIFRFQFTKLNPHLPACCIAII
ncbi:hypothetical protein EV697_10210 [Bisgaardia hudsonensis]|uniref:Restriction endonuclease type I HsdR N-terminal domain-containing protein n=1 Tax=Bisgaardia hudsonensis TaxID=109472 RepID=A0A4V2SJ58_9PAST|nr:type I restriction endonuclease [Bisgaardia hudsonensis]QLB13278.1 hypothetical protein A6A11_06440 [Bisgaardia hudsonensis]TCP13141.1 hypothetical protein EV697_10210 [Bisgaardia hudsonensis]